MTVKKLLQLLRQCSNMRSVKALPSKTLLPQAMTVRSVGNLIPKTQYDVPINKDKLSFPRVISIYWETIPLFVCTGTAMTAMFFSIFWAIKNKVDVVYTTHNRRNISRTMDLRNPSVHKLIIINQKYKPWPELQAVLDRMNEEQCKRTLKANPAH